jgi:hypothetical protein
LQAYALAIPKKLAKSGPRTVPGRQEEAGGNVHPAER